MKKAAPWIILLLILGGLATWYLLQRPAPEAHPSVVELPEPAAETGMPEPRYPVGEIESEDERQVEAEPLPALTDSDQAVANALAGLVDSGALDAILVPEQIVPRMVATIDGLDARELAPLAMPVRPPEGKFKVAQNGALTIAPANFERYAPHMALVRAVPVEGAVSFYRRHYPLFQQAYEDLGFQETYFNDRLVELIDHLLATPVPGGSPALRQSEAVYLFEDEALEALSAGQKMLLRIGPENADLVKQKLSAFRAEIAPGTS